LNIPKYFCFIWAKWIKQIIWPVECPVCGRIASIGCLSCLESLLSHPVERKIDGDLTLLSGAYHQDICRELVLRLKYEGWGELGHIMGRALARSISQAIGDALVPIPLHRQSKRPWNQAELIAQGISQEWNIPVFNMLKWKKDKTTQTSHSSMERRTMQDDVFHFCGQNKPVYSVILVDDVSTTGTTLRRATSTLRKYAIHVETAITWSTSLRYLR
jgi:ComF family protein